ncbi:MAG: glycosyltransferase family 4 protein [Deltaproteobacteria bacterium]
MKNILYLYTNMNIGGVQKVLLSLASNIKEEYSPVVASCGGILMEEINKQEIKHYNLPLNSKRPKHIIASIKGIIKIIDAEKISIIHSHHRYTTLIALIISKFRRIKVIHTEHSTFNTKKHVNFRGENIIAVSDCVKDSMVSYGVDEKNIQVIYNGIEFPSNLEKRRLSIKNEFSIPENFICIGILSRLTKQKGIIYFLKAMKLVLKEHNNVAVFIIGDGPEMLSIEKFISDNDISQNIKLCKIRKDIYHIINELDFFALPSLLEGLPISILEIMSQGKILVATKVGGIPEVISDGENGLLVNPKDIKGMYLKIKNAIENAEARKIMGEKGRNLISSKFSIDKMTKQTLTYYNKVYSSHA